MVKIISNKNIATRNKEIGDKNIFSKLKINLLDLFFPPRCVSCGILGNLFCDECKSTILFIRDQTCPSCNKISPKGKFCSRCRPKNTLSGIASACYFRDGAIKEVVHSYKYEGVHSLSNDLAPFLVDLVTREKIFFDMVTFVPITKKRNSWRGYNQAEILAQAVADHFEKPIIPALKKIKETKAQVGLPKKKREQNLKNALKLAVKISQIEGKRILLVDDVVTTGTTLNECARVLKTSGAREIWAITVAKE